MCSIPFNLRSTILTRHYAPFDHKPPLTICINLLRRYICLQFMPPSAIHGWKIYYKWKNSVTPTNERKVRTHRTTLYLSTVLASNTLTKRLAMWRQGRGSVKTASRFLTAHTLRLCWWFHDSLPCKTKPQQASSQVARDSDGQFCHCCFPCALHSEERGV